MAKFQKGSIVKRNIKGRFSFGFKHMGIYIGKGQVIHFNGEPGKSKSNAVILSSSIESFSDGEEVDLHKPPKNEAHGKAVKKRAKKIFKDVNNDYNGKYKLMFKNCEDFTTECYEVEYQL